MCGGAFQVPDIKHDANYCRRKTPKKFFFQNVLDRFFTHMFRHDTFNICNCFR